MSDRKTFTMEASCDESITTTVKKALDLASVEEANISFTFNGIDMVVDRAVSVSAAFWAHKYNTLQKEHVYKESQTVTEPTDHPLSWLEVKTAKEARMVTNMVGVLDESVDKAMREVAVAARRGETSITFMHDRVLERPDGSYVGDKLRDAGFDVIDKDSFDTRKNNYRRIKVSW